MLEIFTEEFRTAHPMRYAEPRLAEEHDHEPDYNQEDAAEMERRLRGLGYVG
jgi:hypothetical protein